MNSPLEPGARVRCQRLFRHWRQTPGTVLDVDRSFRIARVAFDNGVTKWVALSVLELGQPAVAG